MAIVYKAYDTRLEYEVAVKVIRTERLSPEILQKALKRFEREAKSLAQLTHPNIVNVLDYGEHAGQPYLIMPYVPGGTLKQLLNGKPMQWQRAARLLIPIARALDYAHKRCIVHRDIKPSNIMITESGEPMLTDFGVAKIIDEEATLDLTGTNATVGTPEYMAPEQVNSKTTDYRVDIYALGIVLYEMVTGRRPFEGDTPLATLFKQATDPLPRPSQFVAGIPNSIEKFLVKALAKKPADRYQSMGEVANALDALLSGKVPAPSISRPTKESASLTPVSGTASKRPVALWASLALVAIVAVGIFLINEMNKTTTVTEVISTPIAPFTQTPVASKTPSSTSTLFVTNTLIVTAAPELGIGSTMMGKDGMTLLYVPAGEFTMGSDKGNENPIHQVKLDSYWIDQTEVTNEQYAICVSGNKCTAPSNNIYVGNPAFDTLPVVYVNWNQARVYCEWAERRLPTEAEWEKAARGTEGRTYPWGNVIPSDNNMNSQEIIEEVGKYPTGVSLYGALDLAGNAWEWVNSVYMPYPYNSTDGRDSMDSEGARVIRGFSGVETLSYWRRNGEPNKNLVEVFYSGPFVAYSSYRLRDTPSATYSRLGFRCALLFQ